MDNLRLIFKNYKYHKLGNNRYSKSGSIDGIFMDGTQTEGWVLIDKVGRSFNFCCGNVDYDTLQTQMVNNFFNAIYYLLYNKSDEVDFSSEKRFYLEYLEASCMNNSIRIVTTQPLSYKLFMRVYNKSGAIKAVFDSFQTEETVDVEIGRFVDFNIHDAFYSIFRDDISKRENINWIVYEENLEFLLSVGLFDNRIEVNTGNSMQNSALLIP